LIGPGPDAGELARRLGERVDLLVGELLPGAVRRGRWWRAGSVFGEPGQSLAVERSGARRGRWKDYADVDAYGDLLDLVAWTRTSRDLKQAIVWARAWLGIETPVRRGAAAAARGPGNGPSNNGAVSPDPDAAERQAAQNRVRARAIWEGARPLRRGDPVDRYLKGRGIDLGVFGRAPAALRYAPSLRYDEARRYPAMVARITGDAGEFFAVHRTFLEPRPDDRVTKAPVPEPKKTLGSYRGGSIKIWRGGSGRPWLNMPMHSTVVAGEGVEDALSALVGAEIAFPARRTRPAAAIPVNQLRVIAAVSLDNLGALELPCQVERLVLLAQRDRPGSPAARKLLAVVARFEAQAIEVLLLPPPAWAGVKDLNDALRTLRAA
jgi:hypothetical protein